MFDFKLYDVFSAFSIGLIVCFIFSYFYFLFFRLFSIKKDNNSLFVAWLKEKLSDDYTNKLYAFIMPVLIYAFGLLIQDATDHLSDSEVSENRVIEFFCCNCNDKKNIIKDMVPHSFELKDEGTLRYESLIKNDSLLSLLGKEIFTNPHFYFNQAKTEEDFSQFFLLNDKYWKYNGYKIANCDTLKKQLVKYINVIYYTSKNWCYMNSIPVKDELDAIQNRIDFARSLYIISLLSIITLMVIFAAYYINEFSKGYWKFKCFLKDDKSVTIKKLVLFPFRSVLIIIPIFFISKFCYIASEKNFNKRAMGYYFTHKMEEPVNCNANLKKDTVYIHHFKE